MSRLNEHRVKWAVQGVASGEPMSAETAVEVLNELFDLDPLAVANLLNSRVPCNERAANHPDVVCRPNGGGYEVGLLGILNGILTREDPCGSGVAAVLHPHTGELVGFAAVELNWAE